MGQKVGKAKYTETVEPFLNLPRAAVDDLWEAFNDVAEGFGIDVDELKEIFVILQEPLDMAKKPLASLTEALFIAFDTDENDLTDALELLGTIAACSGMTLMQKIEFLFNIYDFDESGELTIDEITLCLKSTLSGLAKMSNDTPPLEPDIELVAQDALKKSGKDIEDRISKEEFLEYCKHDPDVRSWLYYYDDPEDAMDFTWRTTEPLNIETYSEGTVVDRTPAQLAVIDPDYFVSTGLYTLMGGEEDPDEPVFGPHPWRMIAARTVPEVPPRVAKTPPDVSIKLEHIHGVRCHDVRNNVWYNHRGELVYMAANVAIVYNIDSNSQRFFQGHSDEVVCLTVFTDAKKGRTLVATGELGPLPKIIIWDSVTMKAVHTIRGFHTRGVLHLDFSPDGSQLLTVGADKHHSVALYSLRGERPQLTFSGRSHQNRVLAARFTSGTQFVTVGQRHAFFWAPSPIDGVIERRKGLFGKIGVRSCLSVTPHPVDPEACVTGTDNGQLLVWKGRNCVRCINGHDGPVNVLKTVPNVGVLSGSADCKIRVWFRDITPGLMFDIRSLGSLCPSVRSLGWDSHNNKILIGTMGAEVWEISDADGSDLHGGPLVQGHFTEELWGVAAHPTKPEYCTVGDDQTLRVWDASTRKLLRLTRLDSASRAVSYSANGKYIAIGLGRPRDDKFIHRQAMNKLTQRTTVDLARKYGAFVIMDESDLTVLHETRDSKAWIQSIAFSPDGATLAVGSSDNDVYLYNTDDLAAKGKCRGHTRGVAHLDFSDDSNWVQSSGANDPVDCTARYYAAKTRVEDTLGLKAGAAAGGEKKGKRVREKGERHPDYRPEFEMMFWDANTGEPQRNAGYIKELTWSTYTSNVGWSVQAAWPAQKEEEADASSALAAQPGLACATVPVTAAEGYAQRYVEVTGCATSCEGTEIAVCDVYGRVRVARFPFTKFDESYLDLRGHAPGVANAVFLAEDSHLITIGIHDRCAFQWSVTRFEAERVAEDEQPGGKLEEPVDAKQREINPNYELMLTGEDLLRGDAAEVANNISMADVMDFEDMARAGGDKFMAVKPWVGSLVTPTKPPPLNTSAPAGTLQLEWIHGARMQEARSMLKYNVKHDIVYTASAVGIVMRKEGDSRGVQRFHMDHNDDIVSMAMHPERAFVATGQLGLKPKILVWDSRSMATVRELTGHAMGVRHLEFSRDEGSILASIGMDEANTLILYDWHNNQVLGRSRGNTRQPFAMSFAPSNRSLVIAGDKYITFYDIQGGRNLAKTSAVLGKRGVMQKMLSIGWSGRDCIVGTEDGHLYRFNGVELAHSYDAHTGPVNSIYSSSHGLVSGSADGTVKMWSTTMELQREFDISKLGSSIRPEVRSVYWETQASKLLIGTAASEVYELSSVTGSDINKGPLVSSHFVGELWGLDTHPTRPEYVTAGDDATVRVWDLPLRLQKASVTLECSARSICYTPDGLRVAVGLGGRLISEQARHRKDGGFLILDARDLTKVHEGRDCKEWVTDIKFTPDGNTMGLASADGKVYLYDVGNAYMVKGIFDQHNSFITHLDFSSDSQFMQTNCGAFELLFCDATNGQYIPQFQKLKDVEWESFTCTLGWPVQGVWPKYNDGTEITTVARDNGKRNLVVGDNFGRVRLARYPCVSADATDKTFRAHSSVVRKVRWTSGDTHVLSLGGKDRCIFQWRMRREDEEVADAAGDSGDDSDLDVFELGGMEDEGEVEFMTVKPWLSVIVPPTAAPKGNPKKPDNRLLLDWVHGYRAQDARGNLRYNLRGEVLFPAATLGVIFDKQAHKQSFYQGHPREVASIAVGPYGKFAATGELGKRPHVHIWNALTGAAVAKLPVFHRRGIVLMQFSPAPVHIRDDAAEKSGITRNIARHQVRRLFTVGLDDDYTIAVWRSHTGTWEDAHLEATEKSSKLKVLFAMSPVSVRNGEYDLITGGMHHIKFWNVNGRNLKPTSGVFGRKAKLQPLTCAAEVAKNLVTGCVTGHIYVWEGRTVVRLVKAHTSTINDMHSSGDLLVTGGKDGAVKVWGPDIVGIMSFNIAEADPVPFHRCIRSVCLLNDKDQSTILVGTMGSEIYEISRDSARMVQLSAAHCSDHLWGLAPHPTDPDIYLTSGDDHTVRMWSVRDRKQLAMIPVETMTRCITWSPDGKLIALGLGGRVGKGRHRKDGAYLVLDAFDFSVIHEGQDSRDWIQDIKFSPNGKLLAVGSQDTKIYLYDVQSDATRSFHLRCKCERHNSYITHLDFDKQSAHIQSNCGANELLFYKTADGEQVSHPSDLKDAEWATRTCALGWAVQGIWPTKDTADVAAAHVSPDESMVATCDNLGRVKLFRYPCINKGADYDVQTGHAAAVTNLRFTSDGEYVLTTGGADRCVMQWKVDPTEEAFMRVPQGGDSRPGSAAPSRSNSVSAGAGSGAGAGSS